MRTMGVVAAIVALSACATTDGDRPPARDIEGTCRVEPGQRFVGMRATGEVGQQLLAATRAQILRWVPPRSAVTMDFNPNRLTVSYDDNMVITQVSCT